MIRRLLVAPVVVVAALDALGWLYLVRGGTAGLGPPVANALPLDQLAGHDAVALGPFALVWLATGAALGLVARAAGLRPLSAVGLVGAGVGATVFATTGMSIAFTQQIAAGPAFGDALKVPAVYLATGLAAAGAALSRREATASIRGVMARKRTHGADVRTALFRRGHAPDPGDRGIRGRREPASRP